MKKIKIITILVVTVFIFLGGAFIIYNLMITNEISRPQQKWKFKDKIIVSFKIKNNFLLHENIVPNKILINNNQEKKRLIDIIFEYQVPIYRFRPLPKNKLQQVIYEDIIIELEPFLKDIVCVFINDISVNFLRKILNLETKNLERIIEILLTSLVISERFEILKQYLIDNNLEKYYQTVVQIVCI